jgi:hypothetical protein
MLNPALTKSKVESVELGLHPNGKGIDFRQRPRVARNHDGVIP